MKVKELIDHLKRMDPELPVVIDSGGDYDGYYDEVAGSRFIKGSSDAAGADFTTHERIEKPLTITLVELRTT